MQLATYYDAEARLTTAFGAAAPILPPGFLSQIIAALVKMFSGACPLPTPATAADVQAALAQHPRYIGTQLMLAVGFRAWRQHGAATMAALPAVALDDAFVAKVQSEAQDD